MSPTREKSYIRIDFLNQEKKMSRMNLRTRRWLNAMAAVAVLLSLNTLAGTANADPIQFTLTGTANSTMYGYTSGQSYSFNWIVNSGFTNNPSSEFTASKNLWTDELVSEAPIFSALSGDGLTGSWVRPTVGEDDPWSLIQIFNASSINLTAGNDAGYSTGFNANGTAIREITGLAVIGNIFSFPASYTDPNVYFASRTGTYSPSSGNIQLVPVSGPAVTFNATSFTISTIPEPSTALLTGLGLVALIFRRRRHAR